MAYPDANLLSAADSGFESGTHGWNSFSNSTAAVVTGRFLSGERSLAITATAAGQISFSSPYVSGVQELTDYVARVPIRINQASAGRTVTVRMLYYPSTGGNIGWTDSETVAIDSTRTGWYALNYPVVALQAPATATRVRLVVTITGLAAGEQIHLDDVWLGPMTRRFGELLDIATRAAEGIGPYTATNGTLSRVGGTLATDAGFYVVGVTSTAAGAMSLRSSALYPCTPGKTYATSAAFQASGSFTGAVGLEWFSAADALLSTTELPASFSATSIDRIVVSGVAPENAAKVRPVFRMDATAAGQTLYADDLTLAGVQTGPVESPNGNLLTYEEWSTESYLPAWSVENGTAAREYLTSVLTEGFYQLRLIPEVRGVVTARLDRLVPVTPGKTYKAGSTIFRRNSQPGATTTSAVRTFIDWYDANGDMLQADNPDQFYPADKPDEWYAQINTETRTAPAGAAFARIGIQVDATHPLIAAYYADNIYLIEATPEYELRADNDTGMVALTVNHVPPAANNVSRVTIQRMDEDGKAYPIRGFGREWTLVPNPYSVLVVEDYEAPLGTRVWYSIQWTDASGSDQGARILTRTIDSPILEDANYVWFKSPGIPALNTRVMMEAPLSWERAARSTRYDIVGRRNPVHVSSARSGRQSSITVLIWDPEAHALFDSLLDSGSAALVQAMPGYGIDGNLYVSIGDVEAEPLDPDAREAGWRWTLAITEVDRPTGGLEGSAASTWGDILNSSAYPTWEHLFMAHDTWTNVLTEG